MNYADSDKIKFGNDGKIYVDGVEVRVKSLVFEDKKSMNTAYKDLKNSLDFGAVSAEEFCKELEVLRDTYLEAGSAAWWNYTKKIISQEQKMAEEQDKILQEAINSRVEKLSQMYDMNMISAKDYYNALENVRDTYMEKDTDRWVDFTADLAKTYSSLFENAKESAESLGEELMGPLLQKVTVKDKNGKITDRFYRLNQLNPENAERFAENFEAVKSAGAPSYLLDRILSMSSDKSSDFLEGLVGLGGGIGKYFESLESARQRTGNALDSVFGVSGFEEKLRAILTDLVKSGFFNDITINQTFNAASMSPAEASIEMVNALKMQGVGI